LAKKWYIVHVYSGFENKVKQALQERIENFFNAEKFGDILVPSEQVVELVKGEKKTSSRKFYPGYILVNMELDDETWHFVKNTPKVTDFLGSGDAPTPVPDIEVEKILIRIEEGKVKPQPKFSFNIGDDVKVIDGPFSNFVGTVESVNLEKGKIRVIVSIFGRSTPIELDFIQVTKNNK
jgi:transcriptional antiterminator NusG